MDMYTIKGQTLTDIADALRRKHGETELAMVDVFYPDVKVCKTANATGFDSFKGYSGYDIVYSTATIEGAQTIKVKMAYQLKYCSYNQNWCQDLYVASGIHTDMSTLPEDALYYDTWTIKEQLPIQMIELQFENTNSVTFICNEANGWNDVLGYYAEVTGLDADGNIVGVTRQEQTVVTRTYKSSEMAQAIDDILPAPPESAFAISGNCDYRFYKGSWDWLVTLYGDKIVTSDIVSTMYMFANSLLENIPFELNFKKGQTHELNRIFNSCKLKTLPKFNNVKPYSTAYSFAGCTNLVNVPEDYFDDWDWSYLSSLTNGYSGNAGAMFYNCNRLRSLPIKIFHHMNKVSAYSYSYFYSGFNNCYVIDELVDLPVPYTQPTWTSNAFSSTFTGCYRLKRIKFDMPNGQPVTVKWKSQTIDLVSVGYSNAGASYFTQFGIPAEKLVDTPEEYEALKDDPDWATCSLFYSRYNRDSAVETINSLPDTSAYLSTAGGTNTIKLYGRAGEYSGGAINTMTAEEIAVATAKGWTVSMS